MYNVNIVPKLVIFLKSFIAKHVLKVSLSSVKENKIEANKSVAEICIDKRAQTRRWRRSTGARLRSSVVKARAMRAGSSRGRTG